MVPTSKSDAILCLEPVMGRIALGHRSLNDVQRLAAVSRRLRDAVGLERRLRGVRFARANTGVLRISRDVCRLLASFPTLKVRLVSGKRARL